LIDFGCIIGIPSTLSLQANILFGLVSCVRYKITAFDSRILFKKTHKQLLVNFVGDLIVKKFDYFTHWVWVLVFIIYIVEVYESGLLMAEHPETLWREKKLEKLLNVQIVLNNLLDINSSFQTFNALITYF
jgi:uncharacterized membrane protein